MSTSLHRDAALAVAATAAAEADEEPSSPRHLTADEKDVVRTWPAPWRALWRRWVAWLEPTAPSRQDAWAEAYGVVTGLYLRHMPGHPYARRPR